MSELLCFILDGNFLYLDKVLVSFNDTPIFFICVDHKHNYYVVLCHDIDNLEYIIVPQGIENIYKMLIQVIDMRSIFLSALCYYEVISGATIEQDIINKKDIKDIPLEILPYANEKYEHGITDINYIAGIKQEYRVLYNDDDSNQTVFNIIS